MVDVAITSLTSRFEELQTFKNIFGFLMSSTYLKSLDVSQLKERCTNFANTFTGAKKCDVELSDLISELSVMKFTLPYRIMSEIGRASCRERVLRLV